MDAAEKLFNSLNTFNDLNDLIIQGESEGLFLECKSPAEPNLSKDIKFHLAKAASGFSNTEGGIIIYGISTTTHNHSNLDVLSQIEPIGQCQRFAKLIENNLPRLTSPSLTKSQVKIIYEKVGDKKGVVIVLFPKSLYDPTQSIVDNLFYYRTGDDFTPAPFEIIKRLFAASESPDLAISLDLDDIKYVKKEQLWKIPLSIQNRSIAAADKYHISLTILTKRSCEKISLGTLKDMSFINPGKTIFMTPISGNTSVIYRGVNFVYDTINVKIKKPYRKIKYEVELLANMMRGRKITIELDLKINKPRIVLFKEELL